MAKNMFNKLYAIPTQHTNKHPKLIHAWSVYDKVRIRTVMFLYSLSVSITQGRVSFSHEAQASASIMSLQIERDKELTLLESLHF
jgi:hypothetical protein